MENERRCVGRFAAYRILYLVEVSNLNLKQASDVLDSAGCNWYNIGGLSVEGLTPFAIYGLKKLGYELNN